jgi:hypothetical protein
MLQTSHLQELKQRYASMYIQQEDTEEVEVSEGIRDFKVGDTVKFVNDDSDFLGQTGKITSLSGNGISQKATVKLDKGGKSVTNVLVKVDLIKEEVAEGWKKGKYTIKDENGKILGTYSSGGKAKKVMDDLMQKGDYPELTVSMVEEVAEAKGTAYPATIDTLKMIVREKQNQTVMFKSGQAIVDIFTASAMVAVYDAMKPATKKKFEKMIMDKGGFMKTQAFAMKMTEDAKWIDQIKEDPSMLELHYSLVEITEAVHDKKSTFTMAPFEDLRSVADAALQVMTRNKQEVKEEEVTKEEPPQKLTEEIV